MNPAPQILIVDDDDDIRNLLADFLQRHGYQTSCAYDGKSMHAVLNETAVDLIVLDIMLPGTNGLDLCRQLRQTSTIPIIMLTAVSEDVERIIGLEIGADDYLSKPFNPRELVARIKAILRRTQAHAGAIQPYVEDVDTIYQFSGWRLDVQMRNLLSPDNMEVTLSSTEFNLLSVLLSKPQQVLSRDTLLDLTKNREATPFDRSIDIQISRLRSKIELDSKHPQMIKTVRGGGYMLAVSVERLQRSTSS